MFSQSLNKEINFIRISSERILHFLQMLFVKVLLVSIFLIPVSSLIAQSQSMQHKYTGIEDSWSNNTNLLFGKVKSITYKTYKRFSITVNNTTYDPNSLDDHKKLVYSEEGNLIKTVYFSTRSGEQNKILTETFATLFDEITANKTAVVNYREGKITTPEYVGTKLAKNIIYQFDNLKRITEIKEEIIDSSIVASYNEYSGSKVLRMSTHDQSRLYTYNDKGDQVEFQFRTNKPKFIPDMTDSGLDLQTTSVFYADSVEHSTRRYDTNPESGKKYLRSFQKKTAAPESKNKVLLHDYSKDFKSGTELETKYTYDENGRRVEANHFYNQRLIMRTRYFYDKYGNFAKEYRDDLPDSASEPIYQRKYEYDMLGNWIKYAFYEGNKLLSIVTREMEYE